MGTGARLARWGGPACATCPTPAEYETPDDPAPSEVAVPIETIEPAPLPRDVEPIPEKATWRLRLPRIPWLR